MRMRRRWRWLGIAAGFLALAWAMVVQLDTWRARGELRLAQQEIARGRWKAAHHRLTALAARPGALDGAADYWLGICEALGGRSDAAVRAFARVPAGYAFDAAGTYLAAKANLSQGRLHAAERRLEQALARGGPDLDRARDLLSHIYQIEVRFDDVKPLLRASLAEADDPIRDLEGAQQFRPGSAALRRPEGDPGEGRPTGTGGRPCLARQGPAGHRGRPMGRCGRLAETLPRAPAPMRRSGGPGSIGRAAPAGPTRPWRRRGTWARSNSTRESGSRCGRGSTSSGATRRRRLGRSSEWLQVEPAATRAMERLAELAHRAGCRDRVAELRRRKAEVERAMDSYRNRLWRDGTAPHARTGGPSWPGWPKPPATIMRPAPCIPGHSRPIPRIDPPVRAWPGSIASRLKDNRSPSLPATSRGPNRSTPTSTRFRLCDPATNSPSPMMPASAGLRFVYDNAETPLHQLPEPFGGGLALWDYDGDGWLDVYCVQGGPFTPRSELGSPSTVSGDRLFHNRGDGTFEDVTDRSGIGRFPRGHGHGVAVGDVDGDGHTDVFVTRWRSYALYRNRGDGTFEDATDSWGLGGRRDWPTSAALADLDGDGDLDLYVCHYAVWDLDNPRICRDPKTNAYLNCNPLAGRGPARSPLPQRRWPVRGRHRRGRDRRPQRPRPGGGRRRPRRRRPARPVRRQRLVGQLPVPQPRRNAI